MSEGEASVLIFAACLRLLINHLWSAYVSFSLSFLISFNQYCKITFMKASVAALVYLHEANCLFLISAFFPQFCRDMVEFFHFLPDASSLASTRCLQRLYKGQV